MHCKTEEGGKLRKKRASLRRGQSDKGEKKVTNTGGGSSAIGRRGGDGSGEKNVLKNKRR